MSFEELLAIAGTIVAGLGAYLRNVLVVGSGAVLIGLALIAAWMIAG